ncbi:protein phosphatase 1A-like [Pristis pectinata]|uniref:protein phosphatase 1A-like n=1 Tax=Pristis pectinata TaxID=685728 RepID=UPI00223D84DB|nr:protein phosphatase 1A-like [Pristis pectinata]
MPQVSAFVRHLVKETERVIGAWFRGGEEEEEAEAAAIALEQPVTTMERDHGAANGLRFGLAAMQGWRPEMEDAHTVVPSLPGALRPWAFFAVFDGHGGAKVARYCARHLLPHVTGSLDLRPPAALSVEDVKRGVRAGFLRLDRRMHKLWRPAGGDRSGSTAVAVAVSPRHLFFINCGDSRAVLCRGGGACFYTQDHKPFLPREQQRIQRAGGTVTLQRVNGSLAVSRALGDFGFKGAPGRGQTEQLVSPEPEVYEMERSDADQFVVLACDGVWDSVGSEELCRFVHSRLLLTRDLEAVCSQVINVCLHKGSRDNMSIILVCFPGAPCVSEEALQREAQLDAIIEEKVQENFKRQLDEGEPNLFYLMQDLSEEEIPDLPPGGGLYSKRELITSIYNKLKDEHRAVSSRDSDESR